MNRLLFHPRFFVYFASALLLHAGCDCTRWPVKPKSCEPPCGAAILRYADKSDLTNVLGLSPGVADKVIQARSSDRQGQAKTGLSKHNWSHGSLSNSKNSAPGKTVEVLDLSPADKAEVMEKLSDLNSPTATSETKPKVFSSMENAKSNAVERTSDKNVTPP